MAASANAMAEYQHVGKQCERRLVRDDPSKPDLRRAMVHTKAERILDRPLHDRSWDPGRPIAVLRQKFVNDLHIQAMRVGRDLVFGRQVLRLHSHGSLFPNAHARSTQFYRSEPLSSAP